MTIESKKKIGIFSRISPAIMGALWKWWNSLRHLYSRMFCMFMMVLSMAHLAHKRKNKSTNSVDKSMTTNSTFFLPSHLSMHIHHSKFSMVKRNEMGKYYFGVQALQVHCHSFFLVFFSSSKFPSIFRCSLSLCFSLIGWLFRVTVRTTPRHWIWNAFVCSVLFVFIFDHLEQLFKSHTNVNANVNGEWKLKLIFSNDNFHYDLSQ